MKHLPFISLLFFIFTSCASDEVNTAVTENEKDPIENNEFMEEEVKKESIPDVFTYKNGEYDWEFVERVAAEVFIDSELYNYGYWDYNEDALPLYLLVSTENEWRVLFNTESISQANAYKVVQLELPEGAGFQNLSSLSYDFYSFFAKDIDQDGIEEFVVSADIFGMAGTEAGMLPVRYIHSAVFNVIELFPQSDSLVYSQELSDQYNEETGGSGINSKDPIAQFLATKYYELAPKAEGMEKQTLLRSLIEDLGIFSENRESDNAYGHVGKTIAGSYAVYASFEGKRYFIKDRMSQQFSELDRVDEDFYPLLLDSYQMTDAYSIVSARVEPGEIRFSLRPLSISETDVSNMDIDLIYNEGFWLLREDGHTYFPDYIADTLTYIQDD